LFAVPGCIILRGFFSRRSENSCGHEENEDQKDSHELLPSRISGGWLKRRRKSFRDLACLPQRISFERLNRAGLVIVQDRIELLGQLRVEIVARSFGAREIDDADGALQQRLLKCKRGRPLASKGQQKIGNVRRVEERFIAAGQGRPNKFSFRGTVPSGRGRHRAGMGGKSNELRIAPVALPDQLAEIQFPTLPPFP
jgi:hypothetical protein